MKQKFLAILIILVLSANSILSTQLERRNKKSSRSKSKTREVNFSDWTNIATMIGGFLSHYFGFYDEFKQAQAAYTCVSSSLTAAKQH